MSDALRVSATVTIPADDLRWTAVRASGPGGQNVNKLATKVELRFDLAGTRALDPETRARLRALAGSRVGAGGELVVVSQRTRQRERNLEDARERLRALILRALVRPRPRRPTRPTAPSRERRLEDKRRRAKTKRARQRRDGGDDSL